MTTDPKALSCPGCGSENITSNEWSVDEDHAAKFGADEFSEIWAFECMDCLFAAPVESWQRRVGPWRYPPEMPDEGEVVVADEGKYGLGVREVSDPVEFIDSVISWMPIPPVPEVSE